MEENYDTVTGDGFWAGGGKAGARTWTGQANPIDKAKIDFIETYQRMIKKDSKVVERLYARASNLSGKAGFRYLNKPILAVVDICLTNWDETRVKNLLLQYVIPSRSRSRIEDFYVEAVRYLSWMNQNN